MHIRSARFNTFSRICLCMSSLFEKHKAPQIWTYSRIWSTYSIAKRKCRISALNVERTVYTWSVRDADGHGALFYPGQYFCFLRIILHPGRKYDFVRNAITTKKTTCNNTITRLRVYRMSNEDLCIASS